MPHLARAHSLYAFTQDFCYSRTVETKFKKTAMVFSKRRFYSCTQNNNRKITKIPKTQTVKRTSFRLNKKLNKLPITDYAKVENKEQNGGNHTQAMTAPLFRHLNEHGYKFSMITTRTSSHVILLLEEKEVRLLSLSLLSSKDLY